eukprot:GDKH01024995.1.p1 GENE.GDKH01024995.1~~GDKH01024995.1.p1  ORF type:complete len:205 (-),score=47.73 GDKH01024995.1:277-891(-)
MFGNLLGGGNKDEKSDAKPLSRKSSISFSRRSSIKEEATTVSADLPEFKRRFAGKYSLKSHADNVEEAIIAQGESWMAAKIAKVAPMTKVMGVYNSDFVIDETVAAGIINMAGTYPVLKEGESKENKCTEIMLRGKKMKACCWFEGEKLVIYTQEISTGKEIFITHVLSEDNETLACTLVIKDNETGKVIETLDTWTRTASAAA